ncbi:hypothetical protein V2J09_010721 [Rumex salicifolius]
MEKWMRTSRFSLPSWLPSHCEYAIARFHFQEEDQKYLRQEGGEERNQLEIENGGRFHQQRPCVSLIYN